MRISNAQAGKFVEGRVPFCTHNKTLFGDYHGNLFVVWSYGQHWPLFIYDPATETWFENCTSSSRTTNRHRSQVRPWNLDVGHGPKSIETVERDIYWMRKCIKTNGAGIKEELLLSSLPLC